jgi:ATP-dependent phosphofructokinase / diphosphate-dependent phosphofructokinase
MDSTLTRPRAPLTDLRRVAILFSGGPAPAANAVISTAADAFLRSGIDVIGIKHGYSGLMKFGPDRPMQEGRDYLRFDHRELERTRTTGGILIGTARDNPGKGVSAPEHLTDRERTAPLRAVYEALVSLDVDALVSIGGDDTLKTANKFALFQKHLPEGSRPIRIVHVPKTIDNDYSGIDFTFGYFTAVETLAAEIRNLVFDAASDRSYFLVETMGRSAGWLAYGAAIAGGASLVISVEDIVGKYATIERVERDGQVGERRMINFDALINRIVGTMITREREESKAFGVICLAEGLAELLPAAALEGIPRDAHGHISIAQVNLARVVAERVEQAYYKSTGVKRRVKPLQLGYESRCAPPHAFDVMLGSQLGVGAFRALVEKGLTGVMVSVVGQLDLRYVPFHELVDPRTLVTVVRFIDVCSDFHQLARFLETHVAEDLSPDDTLSNK